MFNTYRKVLGVIGIIFCLFSIVSAYSGGSGEPNNPYQIATVSDWNDLMNTSSDWNKYFIMTADVNLQGVVLMPISFTGVFDGSGHIIRNADINMPHSSIVGLFGNSHGQIYNLGIVDVKITGGSFVIGGLVGDNYGTINTCYATGSINGGYDVGGLVGYNNGVVSACYAAGSINGDEDVGGLVGYNNGTIIACYTTGSVNGDRFVGGLAGRNGRIGPTITDCYSTATVTGSKYVGGLAGYNLDTITRSYASGAVIGDSNVGGLVGYSSGGTTNNSFWDVNSSGQTTSAGGTGKTTSEMKILSTFTSVNWDFVDTWNIGENQTYPFLRKYSISDLNYDGVVNFIDFAAFAENWLVGQ